MRAYVPPLRPYQREAVAAGVDWLKGRNKPGVIIAPTGSGKSLIIASIVNELDGPCVVFQPSQEILEQNAAKLVSYGYNPAVFSASFGRREVGQITLATIGSAVNYPDAFRGVRNVIIDECHLVNAKEGMYRRFLDDVAHASLLGLTATPFRLASNSFGAELRFLTRTRPKVFHEVVHFTQVRDLSDRGYLAPVNYVNATAIMPTQLKLNSTGADWTDKSVKAELKRSNFAVRLLQIVWNVVTVHKKPHVLVFTRFVEEASSLAWELKAKGIAAAIVDATTKPTDRAAIISGFRRGEIKVVANVGVLTTGFDFPELDVVVLARPSLSLALYYQQIGRAVRPFPGKECATVIDMVGLVQQYGKVEDLELRQRKTGKGTPLWEVASRGVPLTNEKIQPKWRR